MDIKLLDGLVRVVARDGSVWWTQVQHADAVKDRDTWNVPGRFDDGDYARLMGPKNTKK